MEDLIRISVEGPSLEDVDARESVIAMEDSPWYIEPWDVQFDALKTLHLDFIFISFILRCFKFKHFKHQHFFCKLPFLQNCASNKERYVDQIVS